VQQSRACTARATAIYEIAYLAHGKFSFTCRSSTQLCSWFDRHISKRRKKLEKRKLTSRFVIPGKWKSRFIQSVQWFYVNDIFAGRVNDARRMPGQSCSERFKIDPMYTPLSRCDDSWDIWYNFKFQSAASNCYESGICNLNARIPRISHYHKSSFIIYYCSHT